MVSISIFNDFFSFSNLRILPILKALSRVASGPIEKFGKAIVSRMPRLVPIIKAKSNMLWLSQK